jgi:hypothetical protein
MPISDGFQHEVHQQADEQARLDAQRRAVERVDGEPSLVAVEHDVEMGPYIDPDSIDPVTRKLYENPSNALVWAETFMETFGDRRGDIDVGTMIGWFANAMELSRDRGFVEGERSASEALGQSKVEKDLRRRVSEYEGLLDEWVHVHRFQRSRLGDKTKIALAHRSVVDVPGL